MANNDFKGLDLTSPPNRIPAKHSPVAINIRPYLLDGVQLRTTLSDPIITIDSSVQSIARMNDTTPLGPPSGYVIISESDGGSLYAESNQVAIGLSGNPISIVPFRPATSVQPWAYIGDNSENVTINTINFNTNGMLKVRSDGLTYKMGIMEPQILPTVVFDSSSTPGVEQILYRYTYRSSVTGATSNPSPESIPGFNSQFTYSGNYPAAVGAVVNPGISYNTSQWEAVGDNTLRTVGGLPSSASLDYVIATEFGLSVPTGVTITGASVDLAWDGESAGTGILNGVALYYQGKIYGNAKSPGTPNIGGPAVGDAVNGGVGDNWGASLVPSVVNDPSFGFGVQINTKQVGSTNRSFLIHFTVTIYTNPQNATITATGSSDPQVDKIDFYRWGSYLPTWTYVGTANDSAPVFKDTINDLDIAGNQILQFDNYEPFPSIDLPRKGTINVVSGVIYWVSGDKFNIRWLAGTIIIINGPSYTGGGAYVLDKRPTNTTTLTATRTTTSSTFYITSTPPPDGAGLSYEIAEPTLAAQPLPYLFGPTDNINFMFGVGDPLRPGTLYWCKGGNLDSAPDTNQMEVTDPSEALVNGAISTGIGVLFSIYRAWIIMPNFFNAFATVSGTSGSTWTLQDTSINKGLFIPRCVVVEGGGKIFFRTDDGIHFSQSGLGSKSITDATLYPLFTHEGSTPTTVIRNGFIFYPPDDSKPQGQQFSIANGFLYYDYLDTNSIPRTLVFDIEAMCWILDVYNHPATIHSSNLGESVQGVLVGCSDGSIRQLESNGTESPTATLMTPAIGGSGWQSIYEVTVEYLSNSTMTFNAIAADSGNGSYGPLAITIPSSGGVATKYTFKIGANKFKWMWFQFQSTNKTFQIYLDGFAVEIKNWGDQGLYRTVQPFHPSGGLGAQK